MLYIKFIRYSCFKIIKVVIAKHGGDRESMNRGEKDIKGNFKATYTASDMRLWNVKANLAPCFSYPALFR